MILPNIYRVLRGRLSTHLWQKHMCTLPVEIISSRPLIRDIKKCFFVPLVIVCVMIAGTSLLSASERLPYVTVVPIEKAVLSDHVSSRAMRGVDDTYIVQLDRDVVEDKRVNSDVNLVHIGFNKRDLIKGKVIRTFISKTIQTVVIKPLQFITGTGVVQANLDIESNRQVLKVPLNALRQAKGLSGSIYVVDPVTHIITKQSISILGFDGPGILIFGEGVSDTYWVAVSGFHKIVSGEKVRLSHK
mgnify:CR=1 FL=1